jgi:RNA 3'-terminal phosphate cyclase
MVKKAKFKVDQKQWHVQLDCEVEVLKRGYYPDTVIVKLPDGKEIHADMAYLAKLKGA